MGPCVNENDYKQRREDYQFGEYAVSYWGSYTKDRGERDSDVWGMLCKFLRSPRKRAAVRQIQLVLGSPQQATENIWQLGEDDLNAWTPLHALAHERLDIIYERIMTSQNITDERLQNIEFGTLHSRDERGCQPLDVASVQGHLTIVRLIIENGGDVCTKDNLGWTALHKAAGGGHVEVVSVLIHDDAEINAKDNYGWTALHNAAWGGHVEVVNVLIGNDAEINAKDDFGWTALHTAVWHGYVEVIFLLSNTLVMSQGANGGVVDDGCPDVIKSLKSMTTKFPEDHLISAALGNEFHRRKMYSEAVNSYDASVRKLVGTRAGIDIECLESLLFCDECRQLIRGYRYKCKSCHWNTDYCRKCTQNALEHHEHPVEDLFMIPSQWPLPPHEEEA